MKKYGGLNNQKSLDEIQEAIIVSAPIFRKKAQKSKVALIAGWLVYYFITWMIATMLLWAIGAEEKFIEARTPIWVSSWLIPSIPFLFTLVRSIHKARKAREKNVDAN